MLSDDESYDDDFSGDPFSGDPFSDDDFGDEYDQEMYSDDYYADKSTSIVEDSEVDDLMESLQITDNSSTSNSESQVVLDERLWEGLPRELLEKILTWLPPAAHFRMRSVCQRWKSLDSSPGWLQHYAQVNSRPSCTVMCRLGARYANFFCFSQLRWFDLPRNPDALLELDWELVTADAGLICYQCNLYGGLWLCVCNPLTQSAKILAPNYPDWDTQPSHCEVLKLVVNRQTQKFKVVVLVHSSNPYTTMVYDSMTADWTAYKSFPTQDFREASSFVWKSMIYMQCFSMGKLLAFNMDSGVWSEVDTELPCHTIWRHFIINSNDRILLVQTSATVVMDPISVWVLMTDPSSPTLNFSRSKWLQLPIAIRPDLKNLLSDAYSCFSQTDRICFSTSHTHKWITYTFATKDWHVMPTRGRRDAGYLFFELEPRLDLDVGGGLGF